MSECYFLKMNIANDKHCKKVHYKFFLATAEIFLGQEKGT